MGKKGLLSLLGLAIVAATMIYGPTSAAAAKIFASVTSSTGDTSSKPEGRRIGFVTEYTPGQSITIIDEDNKYLTFDLSPQVEITPASLANSLNIRSYVTVFFQADTPDNKRTAVTILIHPRPPDDFPSKLLTSTPTPSPTNTPTPTPTSTSVPPVCTDIALGKQVNVSNTYPGMPASQAVDGDLNTMWNSGAFAPQSIEIDLGSPQTIDEIRMYAAQAPAGDTTHELWVARSDKVYTRLATLAGFTVDQQLMMYPISPALTSIQWVKVVTTASPSWVAWSEIQVCQTPSDSPTPSPAPPTEPIIPAPKPDLANPKEWANEDLTTIIGYTFPFEINKEGIVPLEAAAFQDIQINPDGFTRVGMVAINPTPSPTSTPVINTVSPTPTSTPDIIFALPAPINTVVITPTSQLPVTPPPVSPTPILTSTPVKYVVYIDIDKDVNATPDIVSGRLVSTIDQKAISVNFRRTSQIVNPERQQTKYEIFNMGTPPKSDVIIGADTFCFVLDIGPISNGDIIIGEKYNRYCTTNESIVIAAGSLARQAFPLFALQAQTATSTPAPGSIRDQYPEQYAAMQTMIADAARHNLFPTESVEMNEVLSTIEDATHIQECANASDEATRVEVCASDILVAPVTRDYFKSNYDPIITNTPDPNMEETTRIVAGVVKVLRTIQLTAGTPPTPTDTPPVPTQTPPVSTPITLEPGDYILDYVFDKQGNFYAAEIRGVTATGNLVDYTQIPAIPAKFVDPDVPLTEQEPIAVISGFCMYRWCCGEGYWWR